MSDALFITLEGTEGSGKTSQGRALASALEAHGRGPTLLTREPGGTDLGERVRHTLLALDGPRLDPLTQLLLLSAARAQLVHEVLRPALERGETVVCVRYSDSTRAYQGGGDGISDAAVESAISIATGGLEPDLTIYLDLDPREGIRRRERARREGAVGAQEGWNSFDERSIEFHYRVREAYLRVARENPSRVVVVDAARPFAAIHDEIMKIVLPRTVSDRVGGPRL
ncbi:MAG: dTMP kinase [Chloroflexota bacterium]|nr:dTMP kinase [Chloroflexota bacterium]